MPKIKTKSIPPQNSQPPDETDQTDETEETETEDDGTPSMPPPGEENLDPNTAANQAREQSKSDETKAIEAAHDARNATGGQGNTGNFQIPPPQSTITSEELAKSSQPKAPEVPLE